MSNSSLLPTPPETETHTLSTVRAHLQALSASLQKVSAEIALTGPATPLPTFPSLVDSLNFTNYHIQQLSAYIARNRALLDTVHAYPLPTFPVQQEALLAQLIHKGEEEEVIEAVERAVDLLDARGANEDDDQEMGGQVEQLSLDELGELWTFVRQTAEEEIRRVPKGLDYTIEEAVNGIEKVRTGVKRKLFAGPFGDDEDDGGSDFGSDIESEEFEDEDVDKEENEDGSQMDVDKTESQQHTGMHTLAVEPMLPPMPLDDVLRFMTTGSQRQGHMTIT